MIKLVDVSLAELYGIMTTQAVQKPQLMNCLISVIADSDDVMISDDERKLENDYYCVEFKIVYNSYNECFLRVAYTVNLDMPHTLPFYDYDGQETDILEITTNFTDMIKDIL